MRKHNDELQMTNEELKSSIGAKLKFGIHNLILRKIFILLGVAFCIGSLFFFFSINSQIARVSAADVNDELEKAMFTRQEFFGAQAIVPLPTEEAQKNLARLAEESTDSPQILEKLAGANEKLLHFDEAEKNLLHICEIDSSKLETLADFYDRHAEFAKEAEIFRKILASTEAAKRPRAFERLTTLARIHELKNYLNADFYAEVAGENPNLYPIFEKLIDNLKEEKNYAAALALVRQAKTQFPERKNILLEKEVDILLEMGSAKEAEAVYKSAFDPFWSEKEAQNFYDFLNSQDHLRLYGGEMKARFKKDPADFDAGIRFALYQEHDYSSGDDSILPVISKMQQAKKFWTLPELVTVSRLLLKENETVPASKFLYTLYAREDFQNNRELRAQILYQIFEMFCEAGSQKLPISKGDLRFYEDVAKTDTDPGIATGILSLIFSDTSPDGELDAQETFATKYFNRAAAYKIFEQYKKENPQSPELAQMYLDLVRIYTADKKPEIAEKLLDEFSANYENSKDFTDAALKLADAFAIAENPQKTRETYQKILDYLGKNRTGALKIETPAIENSKNETEPDSAGSTGNYYNDEKSKIVFRDYLGEEKSKVTYADVLGKLIASLANEKKTTEILAVYSNEIAKYPDEQWLYEQRLQWLEQTNLVDEQLAAYKEALDRFQTNDWRDKLARFFVRQNRDQEFAEFSDELVGKLNDDEVRNYLSEFIDRKISSKAFDDQLYLKLYQSAHRRFPHNLAFVSGLLKYYTSQGNDGQWRELAAEYYFESPEIRELFLDKLAKKGNLRELLAQAAGQGGTIYQLFRADASARLSDYENAVEAYRKLNQIYPNTPEFTARLINFTRSFGQKNRELLTEASNLSKANADFRPSSAAFRTQCGEIFAELGDYGKSREEWEKLVSTASGNQEVYLDTATVYWDYFQYTDALQTINNLRGKFGEPSLYAFEAGAILEAQHQDKRAIGEYVKALGKQEDDDRQQDKAINRLNFLAVIKKNGANAQSSANKELQTIDAAFETQKHQDTNVDYLSLGYAKFLIKINQTEKAQSILDRAVQSSSDTDFIEEARYFYETENIKSGERKALRRLLETSLNPRKKIKYALQTAAGFEEDQNREAAKNTMSALLHKFPTNFGVLTETSDFYWRLGYQAESAAVLQNALPRSRGEYKNRLAAKLSARLINLNRPAAAEQILTGLHRENPADAEVFRELAKACVRTGNAALIRQAFIETLAEMKKSDDDRRELAEKIADLRTEMIDAFTRLKDYKSAVEQHIEIINREPENEDLTEDAVAYVQRYGGAETLLNYYLKLSAEAFKNYRWNVVLARLYQADGDAENAIKSYRAALVNQPEMPELYQSIADIETKRGNYEAALQNMDEVLTMTNDAPENVRKKIDILKKAGRLAEIEAEQANLPDETEKKINPDEFAEAQSLALTEKEKARQLYREAFSKLMENPLSGELKTAGISGYVQSAREEEPLDQINEKLWELRNKLIETADEIDGKDAGEARRRITILDGVIVESIGGIAKNTGTDEEIAALHEDLQQRIAEKSAASDIHQNVALIQDLSRRAGFGDLEETILQKRIDESAADYNKQIYIRNLLNFYNERGAYQKAFDVLEKYDTGNLGQKAEAARLIGNREKELEALRANYSKPLEKPVDAPDGMVTRYLEILDAENRDELKFLTEKSSAHQLQLINFLIGKGERELAHTAITNSGFANAWKVSRNAEVSLALREFEESAECYFCDALQFDSIGNLIRQTPEKNRFLINDDWFRLTREYGEWLDGRRDKTFLPAKFLPAMTENLPASGDEQFKLGEYYLEKKDFKPAIERIKLAIEADNPAVEDKPKLAALAAAYYLAGKKDYAEECRKRFFAAGDDENEDVRDQIQRALIYTQTLQKYGLNKQSREGLPPIISSFLEINDADKFEDFPKLIHTVAASFSDETEKANYFQAILNKRPTDTSLAKMLLDENLIDAGHADFLYRRLIERSRLESINYDYTATFEKVWGNTDDAESVYAQENNYKSDTNDALGEAWRQKYVELLLQRNEGGKAAQLISEIETEMHGKMPRPAWLRTAKIEIKIRAGQIDLAEIEKFTGITSAASVTQIIPPNLERFDAILRILNEARREDTAAQLSEAFFGRMLALGQDDQSNFDGLARTFFQEGAAEKALTILQLMVKAGDGEQQQTALSEIAALDVVKAQTADAAKMPPATNNLAGRSPALMLAAKISGEFGQTEKSVDFRRELLTADPQNIDNKIELAKLLIKIDTATEAFQLLNNIINDRSAPRAVRWQAREILRETGENTPIPNVPFDAFSQYYLGMSAGKSNQTQGTDLFINSLTGDKDSGLPVRQELVKAYALTNKPFAALKFIETDQAQKSDELLRILSEAAEKTGNFAKALEFEKAKSAHNDERITLLQNLEDARNKRAADLTVNADNTRKL